MTVASDISSGARERVAASQGGAFRNFMGDQLIAQRRDYALDPTTMEGEDRARWIKENQQAAVKELNEMLDQVDGWKYWQTVFKVGQGELKDREEFVEDGVDALKFLANMLLAAGVTDEELSRVWDAKTNVNARRQLDGYAGVGKEHQLS